MLAIILSGLASGRSFAQAGKWIPPPAPHHAFVQEPADTIERAAALAPVFERLTNSPRRARAKKDSAKQNRVVNIVHIGDSHTQADMMTGVVRAGMQSRFGNAGRGLVFPYQVAGSNAPPDIISSSATKWKANRLAHPEIPVDCGISGFGMHSASAGASFSLGLKGDSSTDHTFQRVRLFTNLPDQKDPKRCMDIALFDEDFVFRTTDSGARGYNIIFANAVTRFAVKQCAGGSEKPFSFYGASLEKDVDTGVLYHTIGVNGAQFEQYNNTPLFWAQLPALNADCYVVSLGTNEAQRKVIDRPAFKAHVLLTISKLRESSPNAVIMLTTPAGSHTHAGSPNAALAAVSDVIKEVSAEQNLPCWDLYTMTGGFRAAPAWKSAGLMAKDGIHYNAAGYRLQGLLFLRALASAFNGYRTAAH